MRGVYTTPSSLATHTRPRAQDVRRADGRRRRARRRADARAGVHRRPAGESGGGGARLRPRGGTRGGEGGGDRGGEGEGGSGGGGGEGGRPALLLHLLPRSPPPPPPRAERAADGDEVRAAEAASRARLRSRHHDAPLVDGDAALSLARDVASRPRAHGLYDLALSLLFLTGRRSAEVLNGRSRFAPNPHVRCASCAEGGEEEEDACPSCASARGEAHSCLFEGQLKTRAPRPAQSIPLLAPYSVVATALFEMRARQAQYASAREAREEEEEEGEEEDEGDDNACISRRYQSNLGQRLRSLPAYASARRVHGLRGAYANACVHLFDWDCLSPNAVIMRVLGHANIEESLAYSLVRVRFRQWSAGALGVVAA